MKTVEPVGTSENAGDDDDGDDDAGDDDADAAAADGVRRVRNVNSFRSVGNVGGAQPKFQKCSEGSKAQQFSE